MGTWQRSVVIVLMLILGPLVSGRGGRLGGQVSPGPLARAHSDLEGTLKCTKCHGGGKDAMPGRCTACHKDISWLQERDRGFHGSREVKTQSCAACHPDHAGQAFKLIKWPDETAEKFDHRRAGWALQQRHAETRCEKCHDARFQASPAARLSARKSAGGWTGLESTCTSCHEDVHRGALDKDCTKCHDAGKWTVTPGFSHDTTAYELTGKHTTVKCDKCHLAARLTPKRDGQGHLIPVYKPVSHDNCTDCHEDVHKGQFGETCTKCHTTVGWKQIDRNRFDHDKTRYPLRGKHAAVKCATCHQDFSTPALKKPGVQSCGACHEDVHNGTATLAGKVVDCGQCHSVTGFSPSTLTVDQHRNTKYPLEGKHTAVKCALCHRKDAGSTAVAKWGDSKVVIRPLFGRCLDCHADDHNGQLAARPGKGECADCHRVAGWKPSTFDRPAHAKLKLAIDGRHADIECRACHGDDRKELPPMPKVQLGKARFLFKVSEVECTACHVDPHKGRFAVGGARAKDQGCVGCHDTRAFRPSTADVAVHAKFRFVLEGAHRATSCVSCHEEIKQAPGTRRRSALVRSASTFAELRFESAKTECVDCHKTSHGDQFDGRPDRGRCDACHTVDAFQPAGKFNHDRDAAFALKGAHEDVPCHQCHPTDLKSGNPKSLIYRPVSAKCESCHGKESK
jgi:predicted CXXCH cytochrome family protein